MRYMLAMALALGIGVYAVAPAAFAAEHEGPQDSRVFAVTMQVEPGDSGTIAGPTGPSQWQFDDRGHDRN
ncbi:MAG TPA: hypothetical protein VGX75_03885 [bacterium]|nr:hypothetical protein [bacterium]